MSHTLLVSIRLHDGRYHGAGNGPPSPARVFQALVAAAGLRGPLTEPQSEALEWLEDRAPPVVATPVLIGGQSIKVYVPNNDMDAVGGEARKAGKIRTEKIIKPQLLDATVPFLYAWTFERDADNIRQACAICELADQLYQFGRGVDMAWAFGDVLDDVEFDAVLSKYPGRVYRPSRAGSGGALGCPQRGSLDSLEARYKANRARFSSGKTAAIKQVFTQSPRPRFVQIAYGSVPSRRTYELRDDLGKLRAWPLARASKLVVWLRDGCARQLRTALPGKRAEIDGVVIGRKPDDLESRPSLPRVRIIPLPSVGHEHVDHEIRRVLVEVPAGCVLRDDDVYWALSGLVLSDPETGEVMDTILTPTEDESMLRHYGVAKDGSASGARVWRTVTPAALPDVARRRRTEPTRVVDEAKGGAERLREQQQAASSVVQALRHVEVSARIDTIRVQREPFDAHGERVEVFAPGTRFTKERLWHVEVTFDTPVSGPLIVGDGRFLGLGLMAPIRGHRISRGIHAFTVLAGMDGAPEPTLLAAALRRAIMARVQREIGPRASLPTFFTGHERDGSPARSERHPHLAFVFDPDGSRLLVVAPHVLERRTPTLHEIGYLERLDAASVDFRELLAGSAGRLILCAHPVDGDDPLVVRSRIWESVTPYQVTRHAKQVSAVEAFASDLRLECQRRGLPIPVVKAIDARGVPGVGLIGRARLTFAVAVEGPIILGKSRHLGGGLFAARG